MRQLLCAALLLTCCGGPVAPVQPWVPIYDQSIDPAAPPHSIWLLVNPRARDCAAMVAMVRADDLAPEAVYDPAAPCVLLGYVTAD